MRVTSIAACMVAAVWAGGCTPISSSDADAGTIPPGPDASSDATSGPSGDGSSPGHDGSSEGNDGGAAGDGSPSSNDGGSSNDDAATATCDAGTNFQSDPENCGRCGKSCAGGDCQGGLCVAVEVLAAGQPQGFRNGDTSKYAGFVAGGNVYVWEEAESADHYDLLSTSTTPTTPPSPGTPALQTSNLPPFVGAVGFDSTNVYEAVVPTDAAQTGQVMVKRLSDNSAPTKMFTLPSGGLQWQNVAVGSNAIYMSGGVQFTSQAIYRIATPVADPSTMPAAIVTNIGESITSLSVFGNATAGEHLFWLDYLPSRPDSDAGAGSDTFVYTAPAAGGPAVLLDDASTDSASFASDGTYVYWTETNDAGRLMRCPLDNLDLAHVQAVADVSSAQEGIVVQGHYAWVMELSDPGPVYRIDTTTGQKDLIGNRTVGASIKNSYLFGIDSGFIYMASIDGPVYRLPSAP